LQALDVALASIGLELTQRRQLGSRVACLGVFRAKLRLQLDDASLELIKVCHGWLLWLVIGVSSRERGNGRVRVSADRHERHFAQLRVSKNGVDGKSAPVQLDAAPIAVFHLPLNADGHLPRRALGEEGSDFLASIRRGEELTGHQHLVARETRAELSGTLARIVIDQGEDLSLRELHRREVDGSITVPAVAGNHAARVGDALEPARQARLVALGDGGREGEECGFHEHMESHSRVCVCMKGFTLHAGTAAVRYTKHSGWIFPINETRLCLDAVETRSRGGHGLIGRRTRG